MSPFDHHGGTPKKSNDASISDGAVSECGVVHVEIPYSRYRIQFGKEGPLRYCSHLDLMRVWERVLRRAGLLLAYSHGFNPRPKMQIAAGLPLGYGSTCEVVDVWLEGDPPEQTSMLSKLRAAAPEGLSIESIQSVELRSPALQSLAGLASYLVVLENSKVAPDVLQERIRAILSQTHIERERRDKCYDLRPLIHEIVLISGEPLTLRMDLVISQRRGTGRPDEVLEALEVDALSTRVTRVALTFEKS
ncbi:MAG: DUF2344 domain-containing protein [Anaerolineae bacterium]|nr:DUF2344 domain-containing protein [Anaerolineae bacterium]